MERRKLGRSGFLVSPLALGGNVFGWTADEPTSFALLDAFVEGGGNLIDTADAYSRWVPGHQGGESEAIIGKWIARRGRHDDVISRDQGRLRHGARQQDPEEGLHRRDGRALAQAAAGGRARSLSIALGRREHAARRDAWRIRAASSTRQGQGDRRVEPDRVASEARARGERRARAAALRVLQPHYNLADRASFEGELQALCVREQIGVITYFSLAAGFLTGKYRSADDFSKSPRGGGMKKYLNTRGMKILDALDHVARRLNATPTAISLAWLMARPGVTAPIASATSVAQLRDLLHAMELKLDGEATRMLDTASA
jgi:aryl-alcohol dehydrogenase-like predicted oxidoreductase